MRVKQKCVEYALSLLSGKWKLQIIWELSGASSVRFNELRRRLEGISSHMLSRSLRELESENLVRRVQYEEIPPKVEYSLTELARALEPTLREMSEWAYVVYRVNRKGEGLS